MPKLLTHAYKNITYSLRSVKILNQLSGFKIFHNTFPANMVPGSNVRTVSLGVDGDTFNLLNPLVDTELLKQVCSINISGELIRLVADTANSVVPEMLPNAALNFIATSRDSPYKTYSMNGVVVGGGVSKPIDASTCAYRPGLPPPPLEQFIAFVSRCSRVSTGTLMCAVVLLERLRSRLPKEARGQACTAHRLFIASLVIAGKCICDCWPTNPHWASHKIGFSAAEISLMERQMLRLLDYSLAIDESHLVTVAIRFMPANHPIHRSIMTPPPPPPLSPSLHRPTASPIMNDAEQIRVAQLYTSVPSSSLDGTSKISEQSLPMDVYPPKHHLQAISSSSSVKRSNAVDNTDWKRLSTMSTISAGNSIPSNQSSYESDFPAQRMFPDQKQRSRPHSYQPDDNTYKFFQWPGDNPLSNTLYSQQFTAEQQQQQQQQQQPIYPASTTYQLPDRRGVVAIGQDYQQQLQQQPQQQSQQSMVSFPSGTSMSSHSSKNSFSSGVEGSVPKVTVVNNAENHLSRLLRRSNPRGIGAIAGV